ncbi:hypothetical protein [Amycolatopsis sp. GM8]|uniref:hypothetical protein n=1 Tax=Amycolatopsis sp. GM8 TaxID=2896530 RepID=UPI001F250006|nr:hypothetical protein [Amycolatopsis sp. GM8]
MSLHIEWDAARSCGIELMSAEQATRDLEAQEATTSPVLLLGGDGGGALAVEGSITELVAFAERMLAVVKRGE